jgi:two-component system alkaline phosphatase synthesis response regulator PhoP
MEGTDRVALVVDDDPLFRKLLRITLEQAGWRVAEAEDGPMALARLRADHPCLVLLDLHVPGTDGFEIAHQMRVDPAGDQAKIIMVTSDATRGVQRVARANGCDGFLPKPVDGDALLALIDSVMRRPDPSGPWRPEGVTP